ncbi:hypothetical protein PR003_g22135 [Phytophthora rubi]|uniref:Uncharacterized protein n=1 Tax=Phytophthora rubi TaxID=129364 RepID=A0A6A3IG29_9STRA|nr:hypothetical protein PR002_g24405 [Phytophthora rubi]KAE8992403.1 hypothetical protein PR001_g20952 [Phytophthora rubi]KAE9302919.1 hypothetical protein PR003_g22135 [Phytophthora rubi]
MRAMTSGVSALSFASPPVMAKTEFRRLYGGLGGCTLGYISGSRTSFQVKKTVLNSLSKAHRFGKVSTCISTY